MDPAILLEKVRRPDPRGLVRERLEQRLLAPGVPAIGLVLGPPGSGKTTLLSRVAAGSAIPTAWYRAGAEDDDETSLVRHLAYGLGAALGDDSLAPAVADPTADGLVRALEATAGRPVRLVVDDLHAIAGTRAEAALERIVLLRPRQVAIALGSRRPPSINSTRLLVDGELVQLDGEDLRFRSWEVEELFRTVYRRPLSPEAAAALTRRTGGWAAGLQLFHLATAELSRTDRERAVAELTGRTRLIRSYLARNVVEGLPAPRRRFLLQTCTLGELTGELCDALLRTHGSAAVLDELEREQFFTTSTDGGRTFRYHQVLQTHLEVVLVDELGGPAARELYARSAALLEADGRATAAVRAYARAEDWGAVARLLHHGGPSLPADEEWLGNLFGRPGAPMDDPAMVVAGARRLLRNGLVPEAVAAYRHAETLMDDLDFTARCAHERAVAAVWLAQPSGLEPGRPPSAERGLRLSVELRLATRTLRGPDGLRPGLAAGVTRLLAGDAPNARRIVESALAEPAGPRWEQLALRLAAQLADLAELGSAVDQTVTARLEEIVLSADLEGTPWLSRMARGMQAALLLALRPSEWRVAACADLVEDCERHGDRWAVCLLTGLVGAAHAVTAQYPLAVSWLTRSAESANRLGAPVLQVWAESVRAAVQVVAGGPGLEQAELARLERAAETLGVAGAARLLRDPDRLVRWSPPVREDTRPSDARASDAPGSDAPGSEARPLDTRQFDSRPLETKPSDTGPSDTRPSDAAPAVARPALLRGRPEVVLASLGGFALRVDGVEVDWATLRPKARSLLMLLALRHGHSVHREQLIDAIWPEATLVSGTRSLQVAISSLRQHLAAAGLGEDCLRRHGDAYALCLPGATDELADFERMAQHATRPRVPAAERLASLLLALQAYRGDLLPEAGPAEWVVADRDRLRTLAAGLGADAADCALVCGDLTAGVRAARRSIELDPYHDPSWVLLVDLLDRAGDHTAAAIARREHARVCAELGVPVPAGRRTG